MVLLSDVDSELVIYYYTYGWCPPKYANMVANTIIYSTLLRRITFSTSAALRLILLFAKVQFTYL